MRRLLIKLVAIETALVGWLAYWLFLVYANNPSVAEGLGSQLSKFPQLSFTTVDITVLVIIGVLSIFLAFKFQRGLKPGIRLERALQMLENLMKRNLILEAQVAEMKVDRAQVSTLVSGPSPNGPRVGSWEKAFRTPIEAGPAPSPTSRPTSLGATESESEFAHGATTPRPPSLKIEPKPIPQVSPIPKPAQGGPENPPEKTTLSLERVIDKPLISTKGSVSSPTWEDSPKYLGETTGILTAFPPARKQNSAISEPTSQRQPYIPAPVPRRLPPSVVLGPGVSSIPTAKPLARLPPSAKPSASSQSSQKPGPIVPSPPVASNRPSTLSGTSFATETTRQSTSEKAAADSTETLASKDNPETTPKTSSRPSSAKKRFPWEDA